MEYRRRARRGRRRAHGKGGESNPLSMVLIILLAAALVYMLVATSLGAWISENIFAPLFSLGGNQTPAPSVSFTPQPTPTPFDETQKSQEVTIAGVDMYLLQMGVFTSQENAQELVSSLISLGAAGYALKDNDVIRVIASGYDTKTAADSVCARLISQGYECNIYNMKFDEIKMLITASDKRIEHVKAAIQLAYGIVHQLNSEVITYDAEQRSIEYAKAIASEIITNISNSLAAIADISDDTKMLDELRSYFADITNALEGFVALDTIDRITISGEFKRLQLTCLDRYVTMLRAIRSNA